MGRMTKRKMRTIEYMQRQLVKQQYDQIVAEIEKHKEKPNDQT